MDNQSKSRRHIMETNQKEGEKERIDNTYMSTKIDHKLRTICII